MNEENEKPQEPKVKLTPSERAKKAWITRRDKHGPKGLSEKGLEKIRETAKNSFGKKEEESEEVI